MASRSATTTSGGGGGGVAGCRKNSAQTQPNCAARSRNISTPVNSRHHHAAHLRSREGHTGRRPIVAWKLVGIVAALALLLQHATTCSASRGAVRANPGGADAVADVSSGGRPVENENRLSPEASQELISPQSSSMNPPPDNVPSPHHLLAGAHSFNSFHTDQGPLLAGWSPAAASVRTILDAHLSNILVPRVSGTPGNLAVRQYIMRELQSYGYQVDEDKFTDSTPVGRVEFSNVVGYSNPSACRQLVLACHYDSKMQPGFLGATDSAVPCAMLLKMAATFRDSFAPSPPQQATGAGQGALGLLFIFFDGEEAFDKWTATDSLYGSRHLAARWAKQPAPVHCGGPQKNELSRLELFVLLDLIGTSDTKFVMYNRKLSAHYNELQRHEKAYLANNLRMSADQAKRELAFRSAHVPLHLVEDDHVPFKKRGVPILSLLAHPFPSVWHTNDDNYEAIDFDRTARILHVLEQFVSHYQGP